MGSRESARRRARGPAALIAALALLAGLALGLASPSGSAPAQPYLDPAYDAPLLGLLKDSWPSTFPAAWAAGDAYLAEAAAGYMPALGTSLLPTVPLGAGAFASSYEVTRPAGSRYPRLGGDVGAFDGSATPLIGGAYWRFATGYAAANVLDPLGRLVSETDPRGGTTAYAYDPDGRLVEQTDPLGQATTYAYDGAGRLVAQTDPNGHATRYEYDAAGRETAEVAADGGRTTYAYDAVDDLVAVTDPRGHTTRYRYDVGNRLWLRSARGLTVYRYGSGRAGL